jgi:hypothetical protein
MSIRSNICAAKRANVSTNVGDWSVKRSGMLIGFSEMQIGTTDVFRWLQR